MADHDKPTVTSNYLDFVNEMHGRMDDLAVGLDPERTSATNVPNYSIRWSSVAKKWQYLDGSSWKDLTNEYAINIAGYATKLKNARTIRTNLSSTSAPSFDGTGNITPGVTGTLPISRGGTGGATASSARTNLGLGSAASRDVVSSNTDTSGGNKVVTQGWMGLGARGVPVSRINQENTIARNIFWYTESYATGKPSGSTDNPCVYLEMAAQTSENGRAVRIFFDTQYDRVWFQRRSFGQNWSPWQEFLHTSNILKTTGNNDNFPMSQKAVTDALNNIIVAPIGMCYTQYPGTETPSTLFGGTWTLMFNTEGVFFRTEGQGASSFGGGVQEDAIRNISGGILSIGTYGWRSAESGPFYRQGDGTHQFPRDGSGGQSYTKISMDASRQVPTANENRPRNRTVRVWRKTAH